MTKSYYNKKLKAFARDLRKHGTRGEAVLWSEILRAKKFYGLQFNRQFAIENYIVDFICRKIKLIIEIDGSSHQHKVEEDENRDARLEALGYRVLRVREGEVLNDLNNVLRAIEANLPAGILNDQSP
jgi:very-short-patch-repair endonuclease